MLKKLKAFFYRLTASVMICFTLTFTIVGDYIGYQTVAVQATEVIGYEILMILIELILGAMGSSMSSEVDLSNCAQGLLQVINGYNDFMYEGQLVCYELKIALATWVTTGTLNLSKECYDWLQNYLYNQVSGTMSSACDVSSPFASLNVSTTSERVSFSDFSQTDFLSYLSMGNNVYSGFDNSVSVLASESLMNARLVVVRLVDMNSYANMNIYYIPSDCDYPIIFSNNEQSCCFVSTSNKLSYFTATSYYHVTYAGSSGVSMSDFRYCLSYSYEKGFFIASSSFLQDDKCTLKNRSYCGAFTTYNSSSTSIPLSDDDGGVYRIYFNSDYNTSIYKSYAEYAIKSFSSIYAPSSRVYGLSSTAKPYDVNEDDNTVSIPYTSLGITKQVADAVSSALAANPSITDAELNATASDVIAGIQGTTDAVNQNTKTLSTLLTAILSAVTGFKFVTATEISQAFVTTFPWMRTIEDVFGDVYDGILDIPQAFVTTFPWMDTIGGVIGDIYDGILDIPQALVTVFPWADTLDDLIIGLPKDIADALSNGLSISIPDVATKDYTDVLDGIAGTLANVFVVDTDAIAGAVGALADVWVDKLPVNQFVSLYDGISFSDNYSYPVIKIKRFDIFADFYDEEYVILIDFAEYAEYMLWCRNLVKALFWFGFGLSLFKHLKADFHVG